MVKAIADTTRTTTIITLHRSKALFKAMGAGFHRTATTPNFRNRTAATTATRKPGFPRFHRTIRTTITVGRFIRTIAGTQGTTSLGTTKWHEASSMQAKKGWVLDVSPSFAIDG